MNPQDTTEQSTNEIKYCECGCGQRTTIAKQTTTKLGHVRGQPVRFIVGHWQRLHARSLPPKPPKPPRIIPTIAERFWEKIDKRGPDDCWEWKACRDKDGYGLLKLADGRNLRAHRFSWELHFGPIPNNLLVCHNCPGGDNPSCINPAHLWLGTVAENNTDIDAKGRRKVHRGEQNYLAKLTETVVLEIRRLFRTGMSQSAIAQQYNIDFQHVHDIVRYKTWKHVP